MLGIHCRARRGKRTLPFPGEEDNITAIAACDGASGRYVVLLTRERTSALAPSRAALIYFLEKGSAPDSLPSRAESFVVVAVDVVVPTRQQAVPSRIFYISVSCGVVMAC